MERNQAGDFRVLRDKADEARKAILKRASLKGGHCASPLGAVELIAALIYCFDFERDRIVFDVGHQAHAYKILTDRKISYPQMGELAGISPYPDICESTFDHYGTGHSSTSISAALGIAINRPMGKTIAVIGDGSLTGGQAYEALNNLSYFAPNMLIVYNDNGMAISPNVGHLVSTEAVQSFSASLGLPYLGPVDGHDLEQLVAFLRKTQEYRGPQFLHIKTIKGKGYEPAESDPTYYHWVPPFDIATGILKKNSVKPSFSEINFRVCSRLMETLSNVYLTTPAFIIKGLSSLRAAYPHRVIDTGITEQHCVTFSSGLALSGSKVICFLSGLFLARSFDQIIDVCRQNIPMVFVVTGSGVSDQGPTHQGTHTCGMLNMLPNATIMQPCGYREYERLLLFAMNVAGPVFLILANEDLDISPPSNGVFAELRAGNLMTILPLGNMVMHVLKATCNIGGLNILYWPIVKPFNFEALNDVVRDTESLLVVEDSFLTSSLSSWILHKVSVANPLATCRMLGVPDRFPPHGVLDDVYREIGLDDTSIQRSVLELLSQKSRKRICPGVRT